VCHRSSGVLGRRETNPEPSFAETSFLRSFICFDQNDSLA
jgi:hypothetical protein